MEWGPEQRGEQPQLPPHQHLLLPLPPATHSLEASNKAADYYNLNQPLKATTGMFATVRVFVVSRVLLRIRSNPVCVLCSQTQTHTHTCSSFSCCSKSWQASTAELKDPYEGHLLKWQRRTLMAPVSLSSDIIGFVVIGFRRGVGLQSAR